MEVAVLVSPSQIVTTVSVDVKQHRTGIIVRAQELCQNRDGRPGLPVPNSHYGLCGRKVTLNRSRSCVKVEVAVLVSPSQIVTTVSVDVK